VYAREREREGEGGGGGGSLGVRARPARHCPASSLNAGVFEFPVEAKS